MYVVWDLLRIPNLPLENECLLTFQTCGTITIDSSPSPTREPDDFLFQPSSAAHRSLTARDRTQLLGRMTLSTLLSLDLLKASRDSGGSTWRPPQDVRKAPASSNPLLRSQSPARPQPHASAVVQHCVVTRIKLITSRSHKGPLTHPALYRAANWT